MAALVLQSNSSQAIRPAYCALRGHRAKGVTLTARSSPPFPVAALHLPSAASLGALAPAFAAHFLHIELAINGSVLRFPSITTATAHQPADWLQRQHHAAPVHEPAMVAWLFSLGQATASEQVAFFDIGAAYGYFSVIAELAFARAQIFAVEPNPSLADYIASLARHNDLTNIHVVNRLVSDRSGNAELGARNFVFLPENTSAAAGFANVEVEMTTLNELLAQAGEARPVLKIDVEGWQARILPPAVSELARRRAIILLECDTPEKMARFNSSNSEMADLFLDQGYRLFLTDHRECAFEVEEIKASGKALEDNALLAMLPPDFPIAA